jgi:acetolactate synthase-1/2/3 large subunit
MNSVAEISGGKALADRIVQHDVQTVFALAGAGHTHLLLALEDLGVAIVGSRHESGTVGQADGYARTTGKIGFALIIAEQGLPNAITGIMTAFQAGSPVVVLVTRFPDIWNEAAPEFIPDHHSLVSSITKWARTVPSPDRLVEYFDTACRFATEGQPGPVVLTIPGDFLAKRIPLAKTPLPRPALQPMGDPVAIKEAVTLLAKAKHPLIIADAGAARSSAGAALRRLASDHGFAVLGHGLGRGLVPEDDINGFSWSYAQPAARVADVVLFVGARLNIWFGFGRPPRFAADAQFIQIDIQGEAMSRNHPIDVPIQANPGLALTQIADKLDRIGGSRRDTGWLTDILRERQTRIASLERRNDGPIHPLELSRALADHLPDKSVLVGDGADILNWTYGNLRVRRDRGYMDHQPMGAMGTGLLLAIGAAAGEKETAKAEGRPVQPVALVTGDGSLGFYIAELDTARRAELALTIIVSNDGLWSTEYHGQQKTVGRTINTALGRSDYAQIAEGFGCEGVTIEERADLGPAVEKALAQGHTVLLDVHVDPEAGRTRKQDPLVSMIVFEDLAPMPPKKPAPGAE